MNFSSNDKYFAIGLIGIVAIFASVAYELVQPEDVAPQEIVKLERVVIEGKRTPQVVAVAQPRIEQLPRVVIEGRRSVSLADVQVASAKICSAPAVC